MTRKSVLAVVAALTCVAMLLGGCGTNSNPPADIYAVMATDRGYNGSVHAFFVLTDSQGEDTAVDGNVTYVIIENWTEYNQETFESTDQSSCLYTIQRDVTAKDDFKQADKSFDFYEGRIVCDLGIIPTGDIEAARTYSDSTLKVKMLFIPAKPAQGYEELMAEDDADIGN